MELVMRYLFWVVLLVIVALAGGFYFLTVPGLQEETAGLQVKINQQADELKKLAENKKDIKTRSHVDAAKEYAAKLLAQDQAVKAQLKAKSVVAESMFQQAPKDPLSFDEWLIGVRKEILGQAEKANLALPSNFAQAWLDEGKITTRLDRDTRLERVAFAKDVVQVLCEIKTTMPVVEFAKPEQTEGVKQVSVGVYSLDALERLDNTKAEIREKDYLTHAFSSANAAPPALKKLPARPYTSELLDIKFTAPLSVVPLVVQAFETSPRWFAIVRKIDTQRVIEPYAKVALAADAKAVDLGADGRPAFINSHYQEAPVQTQIWVELLALDESKLK